MLRAEVRQARLRDKAGVPGDPGRREAGRETSKVAIVLPERRQRLLAGVQAACRPGILGDKSLPADSACRLVEQLRIREGGEQTIVGVQVLVVVGNVALGGKDPDLHPPPVAPGPSGRPCAVES